jgi:two-component system, chemotaxis family, chemotaxis protein CheY
MSGIVNQLSVGVSPLSCLVVDDSAFMRFHLKRLIGSLENITANEATNGTEAIAKYQQLQPDFVLMDIVMPGLEGVETVKQICDANPGARIIMISSVDHTDKVEEAFAAGAKGFISKPVTVDMLRMTIERVINAS